ncbi:AIPR protein [Desulfonatronum thiosulfatophilum]|uniref:AIPR protein n=1 Tax=Desulfonatronum thiosulfatophilum TaxID=617002 RepID=A0A1G6CSZ6_9BACT|nr:AIPR family protein [Desulfonatronum thiosulfatophilum]SDB36019.1 AIPR protein [Desulfonatronum thiosulfatophilum]
MIDLTYPNVLNLFPQHLAPRRNESASFLIWYFENYLRLDSLEAVDSVCDESGDKGIDGLYLNSDANTIEVYQSKLFQKPNPDVGDKLLREFCGALSQISTTEAIDNLIATAGGAQVALLINRLGLKRHLSEYEIRGYFICNGNIDANGKAFLQSAPHITFIGTSQLETTYVSSGRDIPPTQSKYFDISGYDVTEYIVDQQHRAVIAPIKAKELVTMEGIANQAIFAFNVRGPLGKTGVNKDIAKSIADPNKHKLFPLFHNGITVVADSVLRTNETIEAQNYYVVNGCQSLNSLFNNQRHLTDELRVLTKFIQASPQSPLSEMITRFSNNQNGVKARDFKSNNNIQIRLQNEFSDIYGSDFFYEIKRGEESGGSEVITNEVAGQYLMAFDLKIPWATHRKYQIFEEKHSDLFGRPNVTADRIMLCHVIVKAFISQQQHISNKLFAKYDLTKFFILYVLRLLFEGSDGNSIEILKSPEKFVRVPKHRSCFSAAICKLLAEIITDLNAEIDQLGEDFDYRGKLRDEKWCKELAYEIAATHLKLVVRNRMESFITLYNKEVAQQPH